MISISSKAIGKSQLFFLCVEWTRKSHISWLFHFPSSCDTVGASGERILLFTIKAIKELFAGEIWGEMHFCIINYVSVSSTALRIRISRFFHDRHQSQKMIKIELEIVSLSD
jgi:hypothetical protein